MNCTACACMHVCKDATGGVHTHTHRRTQPNMITHEIRRKPYTRRIHLNGCCTYGYCRHVGWDTTLGDNRRAVAIRIGFGGGYTIVQIYQGAKILPASLHKLSGIHVRAWGFGFMASKKEGRYVQAAT